MNKEQGNRLFSENPWESFRSLARFTPEEITMIHSAYAVGEESHQGKTRANGENFFYGHSVPVAKLLLEHCPTATADMVAAALLHDSLEENKQYWGLTENMTYMEWRTTAHTKVSERFNEKIASMLITLTKPPINGIDIHNRKEALGIYLENLLYAPHTVLDIKICDIIHNLDTIQYLDGEKREQALHKMRVLYMKILRQAFGTYIPNIKRVSEYETIEPKKSSVMLHSASFQLSWYNTDVKILIVEDEHKIANSIKQGLEQERYIVDVAYGGAAGYDLASVEEYDVIILDRLLPGIDGLTICQKLRENNNHTPILILTAKGQIIDKVEGLNSGADDYLIKPFAFEELLARIKALSRRPKDTINPLLQVANLTLDTNTFEVKRAGKMLALSSKEFSLLEYLMRHQNKTLTKNQIINHVWSYDANILPNTVEVFIGYLRSKIDKPFANEQSLIHTVRGFGYKIGAER